MVNLRVDLHVHSCYSPDAISKPETIVRVAKRRGIDVVAITDHNRVDAWEEMRVASRRWDISVVLGEEVRVWESGLPVGELVCLFLREPIKPGSLADVMRQVREQGALAAVAHPFSFRRFAFRRLDLLDGYKDLLIEVRNGRTYSSRANRKALELALRSARGITAGSDAHLPAEIGSVWLEVEASDVASLRQALMEGRGRMAGNPSHPAYSLFSGVLGRLGFRM
ncbi:MAG: PHP domain-containing protein [candidate division KSB1 bacterium]|nr:PHP domain-containing protein [candidate division KSB1 bacterium]